MKTPDAEQTTPHKRAPGQKGDVFDIVFLAVGGLNATRGPLCHRRHNPAAAGVARAKAASHKLLIHCRDLRQLFA